MPSPAFLGLVSAVGKWPGLVCTHHTEYGPSTCGVVSVPIPKARLSSGCLFPEEGHPLWSGCPWGPRPLGYSVDLPDLAFSGGLRRGRLQVVTQAWQIIGAEASHSQGPVFDRKIG